jgi:hypothetical protein
MNKKINSLIGIIGLMGIMGIILMGFVLSFGFTAAEDGMPGEPSNIEEKTRGQGQQQGAAAKAEETTINNVGSNKTAQASVSCDQQYPWCKEKNTNIADLIGKFYNYALALVGVAALGAIIFGGIKYTVSAGNPSAQSDAIQWITGAVWGLVLLLGANLLLRTINPNLRELKLEGLKRPGIKVSEDKDSWKAFSASDVVSIPNLIKALNDKIYSDDPNIRAQQERANSDCAYNCVALPAGLPIKDGICQKHICSTDKQVAENLKKLYDSTYYESLGKQPFAWQVTEAWPPDVRHDEIKHYTGKAVDIKLTNLENPSNPTEQDKKRIAEVIKQAEKAGFKVLNEYETKTQTGTAPHLHLYIP